MESVSVRDAMESNPFTTTPDTPVEEAVEYMMENDIGSLPVVEDSKVVGLVTSEDILKRTIGEGRLSGDVKIGEIMTESPVTVSPDEELVRAIEKMSDNDIKRLVVTGRDGELAGILTDGDAMRVAPDLIDTLYEELQVLEEEAAMTAEGDVCESCGNYSDALEMVNGELICPECRASGTYI